MKNPSGVAVDEKGYSYVSEYRAGGRSKIQPRQEEGCQVGGGSGRGMCPLPCEARKLLKYMKLVSYPDSSVRNDDYRLHVSENHR